jgi:hypothetical protein
MERQTHTKGRQCKETGKRWPLWSTWGYQKLGRGLEDSPPRSQPHPQLDFRVADPRAARQLVSVVSAPWSTVLSYHCPKKLIYPGKANCNSWETIFSDDTVLHYTFSLLLVLETAFLIWTARNYTSQIPLQVGVAMWLHSHQWKVGMRHFAMLP